MLKPAEHQTKEEEAKSWTRQAELLEGVDPKMFFKDVPAAKKIIQPKVADLRAVRIL